MQDLTFGEQVKIILSRKDMTIKELAKKIEVRTGKKMSRQNLTQRLGRDNFQERDMRMIAEILGCPFQLNILDERTITESEAQAGQSLKVTAAPRTAVAAKEIEAPQDAAREREADDGRAEGKEAAAKEPDGMKEKQSCVSAHERDITIGELVDIHEELDALMEQTAGKHLTGKELEAKLNGLHKGEEPVQTEEIQKAPSDNGEERVQPDATDHSDGNNSLDGVRPPEGQISQRADGDTERSMEDHLNQQEQGDMPDVLTKHMSGTEDGEQGGYKKEDMLADPGGARQEDVPGDPYEHEQREVIDHMSGQAGSNLSDHPADSFQRDNGSAEKPEKMETAQEEKPHGWRAYLKQRLKKFGRDQSHPEKDPEADGSGDRAAYPALESGDGDGYADRAEGEMDGFMPYNNGYEDGYPEEDYPAGEYEDFQIEGEYAAEAYEGGYSEMEYADGIYGEEYQAVEYSEEAYLEGLPGDEDIGEINPYTGKEYESNSVRMHPSRIGYVQVYDRMNHQWTDMTEWAFLGYQERKKQLLGKDYDPPIYLD